MENIRPGRPRGLTFSLSQFHSWCSPASALYQGMTFSHAAEREIYEGFSPCPALLEPKKPQGLKPGSDWRRAAWLNRLLKKEPKE